jgi:hypothetical protein
MCFSDQLARDGASSSARERDTMELVINICTGDLDELIDG